MARLRPFLNLLDDPLSLDKGVLARPRLWLSLTLWLVGFAAMFWMQDTLSLGLAAVTVTLIFTSALASLFVSPMTAAVLSVTGALAFNFLFVPPVGAFRVKLEANHEIILMVALGVSLLVGALTSRLRILGLDLQERLGQLRVLNEVSKKLNRSEDPDQESPFVIVSLASMVGAKVELALMPDKDDNAVAPLDPLEPQIVGQVNDVEREALKRCIREQEPVEVSALGICLPLSGMQKTLGAALLNWSSESARSHADLNAAQTLCNLFGMALERAHRTRRAASIGKATFRRRHSNLVLSAIAHEYRTPLTTILSYASQLRTQESASHSEELRMLDNIMEEVRHLQHVTGNMLQLARLDAQPHSLHLDWESIEDLIGSVLHRLRSRFPDWRPTVELAPRLPLMRCDAVLLAQAFENLLDNARTYAGPTPPHVVVTSDENRMLVSVMDRGPGIDESLSDRLFQLFERGRSFKKVKSRPDEDPSLRMGTGVGLALCRAILRAHGGEISWRPREGGGSVFECHLPLSRETAMDVPSNFMEEETQS